jgi:hypothetical protein
MLVNKKHEVNDVVTFKLSNGDEMIAKLVEENDSDYIVSKPCVVILTNEGIKMIPIMFTGDSEKNVPISKKHVMMHTTSVDKAQDSYIQTTTGIQPVSKGGIIV